MESITKEEVQKFLWAQGITPHAANFEGAVIEFILRKFNILSFEVEDTAYEILKSDVQKFQWKLQANAKRKTPKERLIKLHRVRHFIILNPFSSGVNGIERLDLVNLASL